MRRATLATGLGLVAMAAPASAAEIEVASGPPNLSEAIVLAEPGDTIVLPPGEHVLTVGDVLEEKDLTIRGAGEGKTIVIPSGGGEALEDPGVTLVGVTKGDPQLPTEAEATEEEEPAAGGDISTRAQVIAVIATLAIFLFVLELVRRRRLVERYALLWMTAAFALLVLAIWTDGLDVIKDMMGIEEPANAIFILAFGVAFLLLLNFSVVTSRLGEQNKILAQETAGLDQRLGAEESQDHSPVAPQDGVEEPGAPGGA
jgi:hypothetical protein